MPRPAGRARRLARTLVAARFRLAEAARPEPLYAACRHDVPGPRDPARGRLRNDNSRLAGTGDPILRGIGRGLDNFSETWQLALRRQKHSARANDTRCGAQNREARLELIRAS